MNPIILYDNRFSDGALSATDTETGFDVNNIKDLRPHSFWKAASYGTKYITRAPFTKDTLTKAETGLCPADGYAGVYLPSSLDLTPYIGDRIVVNDSALKKAIGYVKSVGHKAVRTIGNSPVAIPDNDNLDNPTNNFTISWEGTLDDWIYASSYDNFVFRKFDGVPGAYTGIYFYPFYNGKMRITILRNDAGTSYYSTSINTFADGTKHVLTCVVVRETATADGSITFYIDKVQFGDVVTIPAAATVTLANANPAWLMYPAGGAAYKPMTNRNLTMWNRALSAAQVADFVDNGVAAADQYGNQTAKYTSNFSAGVDSWTMTSDGGETAALTHDAGDSALNLAVTVAGTNLNRPRIQRTMTGAFVQGKRYRLDIGYKVNSGTCILRGYAFHTTLIYKNQTLSGTGTYTIEDVATGNAGDLYLYFNGTNLFDVDITSVTVTQLGATLDLNESGIDEIASLNSAAMINSPALPYTTFSGASATAFHAESDGSGAHVAGTTDAIPFVSGRRYRVQFTLTLHSGTAPYYGAAVAFAGAAIGGASLFNEAVEGLNTYEFTCTGSDTGVIEFWNNSAPANYDISDFSVVFVGWKDSTTNGLDAAFPAGQYAVVTFNNIVSEPDGSTYNWESVESGFNISDAGGYTYLISEADACDALFLLGHNLGTAGALVSLESTDDETNWTERLAAFSPSDNHAIMKLLTSFQAASKRLKIDTAAIAPYIAVALLGVRMEFPFPPDSPHDPYNIGIESESEISVEGNHLADAIYYYPIAQRVVFSNPLRSFVTDTYKPFWDAHGRLRRPFAWAWDLTAYPDIVYFMKLTKNARLSMPLSVGTYTDSLVVDMEGVAEP